jgi:hypothetical protein
MTAKELFFDFLELVFIIFLCVFVLFYLILGDRLDVFKIIFDLAIPLIIFLIPLAIVLRLRRHNVKKMREEKNITEVIAYISKSDKTKDYIIIVLVSIMVLIVPLIDKSFKLTDFFQALAVTFIMLPWHLYLFKSNDKDVSRVITLRYVDKFKNEIIVFFTPLFLIAIGIIGGEVVVVDYFQAVLTFVILYFQHIQLFGKNP